MPHAIQSRAVGRHWRFAKCCRPKNLPRTSIITNWSGRSIGSVMRVQNNPRGDFEIEGVSKELVKKFSKRHDEIDRKTKELTGTRAGQGDAKLARDSGEYRAQRTGAEDQGRGALTKLQSLWHEQISSGEKAAVQSLDKQRRPIQIVNGTAEQAVNWAEHHLFERRSVVHEHELWRHALEHSRGPKCVAVRKFNR
jgi:hypothetical protein